MVSVMIAGMADDLLPKTESTVSGPRDGRFLEVVLVPKEYRRIILSDQSPSLFNPGYSPNHTVLSE
jgi:hypothetical protein